MSYRYVISNIKGKKGSNKTHKVYLIISIIQKNNVPIIFICLNLVVSIFVARFILMISYCQN